MKPLELGGKDTKQWGNVSFGFVLLRAHSDY